VPTAVESGPVPAGRRELETRCFAPHRCQPVARSGFRSATCSNQFAPAVSPPPCTGWLTGVQRISVPSVVQIFHPRIIPAGNGRGLYRNSHPFAGAPVFRRFHASVGGKATQLPAHNSSSARGLSSCAFRKALQAPSLFAAIHVEGRDFDQSLSRTQPRKVGPDPRARKADPDRNRESGRWKIDGAGAFALSAVHSFFVHEN